MESAPHFRIERLTAFVAIDPADDSEGVVGMTLPGSNGAIMPLIGADENRIKSLQSYAQEVANASGQTVKLVQFSVREDIETIDPEGSS